MFLTRVSGTLNSVKYLNLNVTSVNNTAALCTISKMSNILCPPNTVRGQTVLDKDLFEKNVSVSCIVANTTPSNISAIIKCLKKYLLKLEHFKPIETTKQENGLETIVYLCPKKVTHWEDISEEDRLLLKDNNITVVNYSNNKDLVLHYENYTCADILRAILPEHEEGMASFTKVGHIVHINLREHLLPFKKIIGDVLLEKVHNCKTVVNKTNIIDNTYRNFQMELLAGEDNMQTSLKENKCTFEFDFSTVYWNSRLSSEHDRIVDLVNENDILFDVFAGVGPFSVPAAKKKCITFANDLNPHSFKWLNHNKKINKVNDQFLQTFNKDGHEFILNELKENLIKYLNKHKIHITMNLPAIAVEFLPTFYKLYKKEELPEITKKPIVYLYCFTKGENFVELAKEQVFEHMGFDISDKIIDIFRVRTVSNFKEMMRVTIELDMDILVGTETVAYQSNKRSNDLSEPIDGYNYFLIIFKKNYKHIHYCYSEPWQKIRNCSKLSK